MALRSNQFRLCTYIYLCTYTGYAMLLGKLFLPTEFWWTYDLHEIGGDAATLTM